MINTRNRVGRMRAIQRTARLLALLLAPRRNGVRVAPGDYWYDMFSGLSGYSGHLRSDGQTSYFFDPNSGCRVISGGGVSCQARLKRASPST